MEIHLVYASQGQRGHKKEGTIFGVTVAGSMIVHALALSLFLVFADQVRHNPMEKIIMVDLSAIAIPSPQPIPPAIAPIPPERSTTYAKVAEKAAPRIPKVSAQPEPSVQPVQEPNSGLQRASSTVQQTIAPLGPDSPPLPSSSPPGMTVPMRPSASASPTVKNSTEPARQAVAPAVKSAPPGGAPSTARNLYQAQLRNHIEREKEYPLFARKAGLQGTCIVVCSLRRDGKILSTHVKKPSGHGILDKAAIAAIEKVGKFPPVPTEIAGDNTSFEIPVSYALGQ